MAVAASRYRISGSELVDFVLYWYALLRFLSALVAALLFGGVRWGELIAYALTATLFIIVLLRNYLVMHRIDTALVRGDEVFAFLEGNSGFVGACERLVRVAIMLTVIISPPKSYPTLQVPFYALSNAVSHIGVMISNKLGWHVPANYETTSVMHDALPYYGGVLFILFSLFMVWDWVNVLSVIEKERRKQVALSASPDSGHVGDAQYRGFLLYTNVCERHPDRDSSAGVYFGINYLVGSRNKSVSSGRLWRVYFSSPKWLERVSGLLSATLIIYMSLSEFNPGILVAAAVACTMYGLAVWKNENYFKTLFKHALYPVSYFGGRAELFR